MKRNDETTTYPIADLLNYRPSSSAVALAAPALPAISYHGPNGTQPSASAVWWRGQNRRLGQFAQYLALVLMLGAGIGGTLLFQTIATQNTINARTAASYTGWVSTNGDSPVAFTIEPCRKGPCDPLATDGTVVIDFSYVNSIGTLQPPCPLGGKLIAEGRGFDVTNTCPGGVYVRAYYIGDASIEGTTTDGEGTLTLTFGTTVTTYHLRSATIQEQHDIFGGH